MLNFFKKKPPAPAPEPAQAPTPGEPAGRAAPIPVPPVPAPAAPARVDEQAPWPSAKAEPPVDLGGLSARLPGAPVTDAPPAAPAGAPATTAAAPAGLTAAVTDAGSPAGIAPASAVEPAEPVVAKKSWLQRLKQGLSRTGQSIGGLFVGVKVDENLFEELETALIMADAGVEATEALLTALRARVRKDRIEDAAKVRDVLRQILADQLRPLERGFDLNRGKPLVVMIAGVNGAGKTTSIGKLANTFQRQGASVLLAAGDTFRAAARQQLMEWGARNNVTVIAQDGGDPAAVAFDAVNAGRARGAGVVMVDTAGR
ncbi:MAG TPA: signal recognition particle receptor subunit alpha, partial [Bordetella sp.]|nr:signal recognition particle receptor subunit alpha [Bordetella sp.]